MHDKYRINYGTEEIHEIDAEESAYVFLCDFYQIEATIIDNESVIVEKIDRWKRYAHNENIV